MYSEQCGDLLTYADKSRPDAEGCEASVDNKSIQSFQMMPISPPSPSLASSGGTPAIKFTLGGPLVNSGGHLQRATSSHVHGPPTTVTHQMTSSVTNQVAAAAIVPHFPIVRSTSVQSMREMRLPYPPLPETSNGRPAPPPFSPPPSPCVPLHNKRRHSTQSLQEDVLRSQLEEGASGETTPTIPLCGLPTTPPELAPVISSHNKPRPHSAQISPTGIHSAPPPPPPSTTVPSQSQSSQMSHSPHTTMATSHPSHTPHTPHHYHRGHTRSKSLGPFPAAPSRNTTHVPPTHTTLVGGASQSVGGVRVHDITTTPELSKSSVSLSSKFNSSSKAPPPNPDKGYDFAKHFNLFSPYTSSMALEYCQKEGEGLGVEVHETPPPAVWCMDVWNNSIAVGCGNGQIEVGVVFSHVTHMVSHDVFVFCSCGI